MIKKVEPALAGLRKRGASAVLELSLLFVLLVSLAPRLWYAQVNPLSYDETHNLMIGMLAKQGFAPYGEIYAVIAPFALFTVELSAMLWGSTPAVRTLLLLYGLAGVAALFFLVRRQATQQPILAALLAAMFFSFTPHYFFVSTSINLEAGALAFALLSIAAAEYYRAKAANGWLFLSGAFFGLSLGVKVFAPFALAIIALQLGLYLLVDRKKSWAERGIYLDIIKMGAIWLFGFGIVAAALLFMVDRASFYEQVLASRFALREAIDADEAGVNIAQSLSMADIVQYAPLLLGAILGFWLTGRRAGSGVWVWGAWLVLGTLFLLSHEPVRPRHTVMILPPLAAMSGVGVAALSARIRQKLPSQARWLNPALIAGILALTVAAPLGQIHTESFTVKHPARQAVIEFVRQATAPDDCIISKENRLHFLAGRLSTPYLSLISTARLFSGLLSAEEIVREADIHDCPALVYAETFDELIPDLRRRAGDLYALRLTMTDAREPDYAMDVYAVKMDTRRKPSQRIERALADQLSLAGYDLTPGPWQPGQAVYLSTYWQALKPLTRDYKMFVHLADEQGNVAAGFDHYPFALHESYQIANIALNPAFLENRPPGPIDGYPTSGMIPTRLWLPGQTLKETTAIFIPTDLPAGAYSIHIGMYDETTLERLEVPDDLLGGEQNQITIATEIIQAEVQ